MSTSPHVIDVTEYDFPTEVLARSKEVPVVVDFWAAWCGPCRTLGPMLEQAVAARGGDVVLAKVDVDQNQGLAQQFRVQGIPAVKAFRDGEVVAEFTGALPQVQIEAFFDQIVPTEADRLAASADVLRDQDPAAALDAYRQALELDSNHRSAALGAAELVVEDEPEEARRLATPHRPDPRAEAVLSQADLAAMGDVDTASLEARIEADPDDGEAHLELGRLRAAQKDYDEAIAHLLAAVGAGGDSREPAREQLVSLFGILGDDDPRVRDARPRLARLLF